MLGENIKKQRQRCGLTQEQLATKINVTRQTISKWEKNYSVPDAALLVSLAEIFEIDTSELLGVEDNKDNANTTISPEEMYAKQLANIAEQMAVKNRRSHKIWKTVGITILVIIGINILVTVLGLVGYSSVKNTGESNQTVIEDDSQTN